ncbi:C39 family peptidase [Acinetobacter baumannii]|uniref:C39 family peptidase n=2 Tax=Acinetobacter baumannii TaxID=470 RepID=A0A5P3MEC4_ACIBA|nr:C39 family peptidase [Acinetobacter baumannii]MCR0012453.1 C39 family peptidase [Acinetobacter baumannii]MDN8172990.1 C39 family peptidase [Acinetobacter baumannii]MDQ8939250.1 C39 family peptidase [Acinetobacter baumannii]MDQ9850855.1 C39 family peptidase [Acinetobacter baumannii]MDQ9999300.1 C39 family peptidase [Acinetobacter baumannii]
MYIKIILLLSLYPALSHSASIYFNEYHNGIKVESWKDLRDKDIVKQDLDFSCGAASIATLLNGYYNQKVTEEEVLKIMDKGDMMASFDDMQKALDKLGFRAKGYAVSLETLEKLKIPVIAYIKHRKNDHFTVISGINNNFVRISDPSLGKRVLSTYQFQEMWETRADNHLKGKILVILPKDQSSNSSFFTKNVKQPTTQAIKFLASER